MGIDLSLIWAVIIIFGIMMYVVMDGFDLGVGILFPFVQDTSDRDVMMNTVAPIWDGNETWLVLGGAGLFAAFPLAYSVVLSALYLPIIFMLMGLIFRGVAFEFRFKASKQRQHIWDKAFIGGSLAATFFQGVALGAYIDGFEVVNRRFAGGAFDWLTPFSVFCGLALIAQAQAALGSLDRVVRVVKLTGFVNSTPGFTDQPEVINGCSDLMVEVFGEAGRHARAAVSAPALPRGVAVEIEAIFQVTG